MVSQEFQVHRLERLEIVFPLIVQRCAFAGHEIVVQFDDLGGHPQNPQLLGQPERRGRLSAGGRSGDENDLHVVAPGVDQVRHTGVLPFLPCLAQVNEFHGLSVQQFLVQVTDTADPGGMAPRGVFFEGGGKLALWPPGRHFSGIAAGRRLEAETLVEGHQAEHLQVAGRRNQRPVKRVHLAVQVIHPAEIPAERAAEFGLIMLTLLLKEGLGLLGRNLLRAERKVGINQFPHPGTEALHPLGIRLERLAARRTVPQFAVQAARQGMLGHKHLIRIQVPHGVLEQEAEGADVRPASVRMIVADKGHFVRKEDIEAQFFELVVHQRRQHRVTLACLRVCGFGIFIPGEIQQGGSGFYGTLLSVVRAMYLYHKKNGYQGSGTKAGDPTARRGGRGR